MNRITPEECALIADALHAHRREVERNVERIAAASIVDQIIGLTEMFAACGPNGPHTMEVSIRQTAPKRPRVHPTRP